MSSLDEIREARMEKLGYLKKKGVDPYPLKTPPFVLIEEVFFKFSKLKKRAKMNIVGRLMARREHGGSIFCDLYDGTGKFQIYMKKDDIGDDLFNLFKDQIDIGDFISCEGKLFITKKKEKTLKVKFWRLLSKSLRTLPEKWHGLQDVEARFRQRYLDILMSDEIKSRFVTRSQIISNIRKFLDQDGYLEVETPILQPMAGGATALPFKTHHKALGIDLYLRIAKELYLKELLVGGFSKIYEIGKDFRNEGIDATHNPEFTMLEFYEAYSDAGRQRVFIEKLLKYLVKRSTGKSSFEYSDVSINFAKKFSVISYFNLFKKYTLIPDIKEALREDVIITAKRLGVGVDENDAKEKILDNIFKKLIRPKLIQPTFIIDYPVEFSPFAKRDPRNPELIDRFQLVIGGLELVNAFSELNDPIDQKERFLEQDRKREAGEEEVSPFDKDYLEAMEYGMPPAGGVGIGIDRLVMLLTDAQNIREVVLFPTLRPRE